jgi:hypothetical protein
VAVLLPLLLALLGFVCGMFVGGQLAPDGSGLAGPAIALWYGIGGMVIALLAGVILARRLPPASLRKAVLVAAALATITLIAVAVRIASMNAGPTEAPAPGPVPTVTPAAQRYTTVDRSDLPLGLGVARFAPTPGRVLRFYAQPREGDRPGDLPPVDSVTFGDGVPHVEIATAPPWLVPEHLKMDYELFVLRALTLTADWVEVVGNSTTGETWWIARSDVHFVSWPQYLLSVTSVETLDAEENPVRYRPHDEAGVLSSSWAPLPPLAVQGDWLRVATINLADRIQPSGWIRWRSDDRLLVVCNPLS